MLLQTHTGEKLLLQLFLKVIVHCNVLGNTLNSSLDTDFSLLVAQSCYISSEGSSSSLIMTHGQKSKELFVPHGTAAVFPIVQPSLRFRYLH